MNISLRHLRAFVSIATEGSFTRAARSLYVTQSTLTKTIQELEDLIGLQLFNRSTRRVCLTTHGRSFVPTAQRLINDFNNSIAQLREQTVGAAGAVTVASDLAFASAVLPGVFEELGRRHPGITTTVIGDTSAGIIKRIGTGQVDVGVGSYVGSATNTVNLRKLLTAKLGVLFPPRYNDIPATVSVEDLLNFPVICNAEESSISTVLKTHSLEVWMKLSRRVIVTSLDIQLSLVRQGIGVCIVSPLAASHPSACGLPFRLIDAPGLEREVYLLTPKLATDSPATTMFISILDECLRKSRLAEGVSLSI